MDSHDARGGYLPDDAVEVGKDGESILGNYKGTVVADGYVVYENLSRARPFRLANCWAASSRLRTTAGAGCVPIVVEKEWRSSTTLDCIRSCCDLGIASNIVELLVTVDAS